MKTKPMPTARRSTMPFRVGRSDYLAHDGSYVTMDAIPGWNDLPKLTAREVAKAASAFSSAR